MNKKLVNRYKYMYEQTQQIVPAVYASLAIALHREYGWGFERINRAFASSQSIWENYTGNLDAMIDLCKVETGIDVIGKH